MRKKILQYLHDYVSENIVLRVMRQSQGKPEWVKVKDYPIEWKNLFIVHGTDLNVFGGTYKKMIVDIRTNKIIWETPDQELVKDSVLQIVERYSWWDKVKGWF